jgi:tetratricopeptide (TPR) repeat protein
MSDRGPGGSLAAFLGESRQKSRLSLREAAGRVTAAGGKLSHSTLLRIEQGRLQPGAAELLHLAVAYDLPTDWALDAVEAGRLGATPVSGTIEEIVAQGVQHWKRGEFAPAIACALALRGIEPFGKEQRRVLQQATLDFATYARGLGWFRLSRSLLDDVLKAPATPSLATGALILASSLARASGSLLVATAMIEHAARVVPKESLALRGQVAHQRAKLLSESGQFADAATALSAALRIYARAKDHLNANRARILQIAILEGQGKLDAAVSVARKAVADAREREYRQVEAQACMELGRVLVVRGDHEDGIRELRGALGLATLLGDANLEFHVQYRLWKAFQTTGDAASEDLALRSARHLLARVQASGREAEEIRRGKAT